MAVSKIKRQQSDIIKVSINGTDVDKWATVINFGYNIRLAIAHYTNEIYASNINGEWYKVNK